MMTINNTLGVFWRSVLCLALLSAQAAIARCYPQHVKLHARNTTLTHVLTQVEQQAGCEFIYDQRLVAAQPKRDVSIDASSLSGALEQLFNGLPIHYEIRDNFVVLSERKVVARPTHALTRAIQDPITGVVRDTLGNPLANITVQIKATGVGTRTDDQGAFQLQGSAGATLLFSALGYEPITRAYQPGQPLSIVMRETTSEIGEVVVTALGIQREKRELTYNVQDVKGEEITRVKDANFVNSLSGKLAGVTINPSASGVGGATRVVMRGTKSINQNNNVLYVIDGMPMPNLNGGNTSGAFGGTVSGEGISSINPEDIESISALTGPSATALYGNQGANGVIVVNTKKGNTGKFRINLSHSTDLFNPFVMPRFQHTYGQTDPERYESWGAKLEAPSSYRPRDFFQTGHNIFNALSMSGGTEKSQTRFSASSNNAEGIIRNNDYDRYNFYLRHTANLTERLTTDFNAMYVLQQDRNMISQGQYFNPLVPVYLFPPAADFSKYQVFERFDPNRRLPTQFWPYGNLGLGVQNPYWLTDAQSATNKQQRYMLSATAKYRVTDWFDVTGRVRVDNTSVANENKRPAGTDPLFASEFGYYGTGKNTIRNTYADVIASVTRPINDRIRFHANVGGSIQDDHQDGLDVYGNLTRVANVYNTNDNMVPISSQSYQRTQLQSIFATARFDLDRWLFLDATGRYEWPSQLPKGFASKTSYFYPSVGLSSVLTDALGFGNDALSYVKVRVNYAEVGNPPAFGLVNPVYPQNNNNFRPAPFPDFVPERTRSYEVGAELKFLRNQLAVNVTLYQSNTTNQLLITPVTGSLYSEFYYNAGDIQNKGIEASLDYSLPTSSAFQWNSGVVFSLNRNRINRLSEGFVNPATGEVFGADTLNKGGVGTLQNLLVKGGTMADLYVSEDLLTDNQGHLWADPGTGQIQKQQIPLHYVGTSLPDFTIGWRNTMLYKDVSFSFLLDARVGGVGISATQSVMDAFGVSEQSATDRDNGGVVTYQGKKFLNVEHYYNTIGGASGGSAGLLNHYVYSSTNVRLREAALSYTLPDALWGGRLKDIQLSLIGRNLFMFYNKAPFDPESSASTGTYYQGIDYFQQPSYRSFGISVRAQF